MSPASYQTAPPRAVCFSYKPFGPILNQTGGASWPLKRAGNETRTRDPDLGKVVLYQLSYSRFGECPSVLAEPRVSRRCRSIPGGGDGPARPGCGALSRRIGHAMRRYATIDHSVSAAA